MRFHQLIQLECFHISKLADSCLADICSRSEIRPLLHYFSIKFLHLCDVYIQHKMSYVFIEHNF